MPVALIARHGKFLVAEQFFAAGPRIVVSRDSRYAVGDLVEVAPVAGGRRGGRGRVLRRLGRPTVARDVIGALLVDRGYPRAFERAVTRAAQDLDPPAPPVRDGRRDLRDLASFTVDPRTARDFDDAISAQRLANGDGWRVWVHIADVSAYVRPRDGIDRAAFARGTSVYVPGLVEPMLPRELSNGICSLRPGEDRLVLTVEFVVSAAGTVTAPSFYRAVIRSQARLDYDAVDTIFAGGTGRAGAASGADAAGDVGGAGVVPPSAAWLAGLGAARAAAAALAAGRERAGAVVIDSAEPEFEFNRAGDVVAMRHVVATESHSLIEQLMIAANEQVATFLSARKLPALYRVHERPEPASVLRAVDQLASLSVPTPPTPRGAMTSTQAEELAGELSRMLALWLDGNGGRGSRALNRIVLRSLQQAYYDHVPRGHSGLRLANYCHFTSPIRRYPDLICHRSLCSAIAGEPVPDAAWVAAAGPACSAAERRAMLAERDADDIARCFLLAGQLNSAEGGCYGPHAVFEGEIVGLIAAGAFVAFGERGEYEGLLPVRRLRGDWWDLSEERTALIGSRSGQTLRLGDTVTVRVDGIDAPRGRVDLVPV